jgi:hemerythrin-like metal-binding protein
MSVSNWDPSLETGDAAVDAQHRHLFEFIAAFEAAVTSRPTWEAVRGVMDHLAAYTARHFRQEERLMAETGYPEAAEHVQIHQELLRTTSEIMDGYRSGRLSDPTAMGEFLRDWLRVHIREHDQPMIQYVQEQRWAA